jgi:adenylate kinase
MITILFGPPCVGKGTVAKELCSDPSYVLIPTGELLRAIQGRPSAIDLNAHPNGDKLQALWQPSYDELIRGGRFIPDSAIIEMVELYKAGFSPSSKFLYDGFPRSLKQAIALDVSLRQSGQDPKDLCAISLDAPDSKLQERNQLRCMTEQRDDDDPAIFAQRLATYREKALDVCDYYKGSGRLVPIDASGTVQETVAHIRSELGHSRVLSHPLLPPLSDERGGRAVHRAHVIAP